MKLLISLLILIAVQSAHAKPPADYQVVWEDNFDGPAIDKTKWNVWTNWRGFALNSPDAMDFKEGALKITTFTDATRKVHITGAIDSHNHIDPLYGYIETRIRFHDEKGEWCGFWLQSNTMGMPIGNPRQAGTELDIVEHRKVDQQGNDVSNLMSMNVHWDGYSKDHKSIGTLATPEKGQPSLQGNWHTYAVLWTASEYRFYLDDVEQWKTEGVVSQHPQHIRLTCETRINAPWAGVPPTVAEGFGSKEQSKAGMDIDWIRVWQKKEGVSK